MQRRILASVLVSIFLIPLFASAIPRSTASPGLTNRNVEVWSSTTLPEPRLVAMSADGRYIVAAEGLSSSDQYVCLLDANQNVKWKFSVGGFNVSGVPLESPEVTWVDISDDGSYIAFGGYYTPQGVGNGFMFLFDQSGLRWYKTSFLYGGGPTVETDCSGALSGDGSRVAIGYVQAGDGNSSLEVYDNTGQFKWGYVVPWDTGGLIASVSISSDGQYVALGASYGMFLVHGGALVWEIPSDTWVWPVRISRDGTYVLGYRVEDNNVICYSQTGSLAWNQTIDPSVYNWDYDLAISGDGRSAVATGNSTIYFFGQTGLVWTYNTNVVDIDQVKISADGYFIVATSTWGSSSESNIFHLNKFGKLIWQIPQTGDHYYVIPGGALAISVNGEYFCSTEYSATINNIDRYFSKKYFNYRFVTPDSVPQPIGNLDLRWYFSNGTLYGSTSTNSSGWITFFDPHFVDYSTEAYYWQTKVGQYTPLVKSYQYESVSDHVASLFDWTISIHDVANNPLTVRVETYLWNGTLYDNRTASSLRFEDLPNQTYTFKVYYPPGTLSSQQTIALTQEEQTSTIQVGTHDVAVASVSCSKTVVGQKYSCTMNVTVSNKGVFAETFNLTVNASSTTIGTQTLSNMLNGTSATLTFVWNTTGFAYGNYTITAFATPVPGETNTADNTFVAGSVLVTIPGDLNGDFKVTLSDLVILANAYGAKPIKWNPNADINENGKVDLPDLVVLALHYGQHYP